MASVLGTWRLFNIDSNQKLAFEHGFSTRKFCGDIRSIARVDDGSMLVSACKANVEYDIAMGV